jgi:hypothetical protein
MAGVMQMRAGSRVVAVLLAAVVWVYAGMSVASRSVAQHASTPSVIDAAACAIKSVVD